MNTLWKYSNLVRFMQEALYEESAPVFLGPATEAWKERHREATFGVLTDLNELFTSLWNEYELQDFLWQYLDHADGDPSARDSLCLIKNVLQVI